MLSDVRSDRYGKNPVMPYYWKKTQQTNYPCDFSSHLWWIPGQIRKECRPGSFVYFFCNIWLYFALQLFNQLEGLTEPSILFLDEADSLFGKRESASKSDETSIKVKSIFLERLEELNHSSLNVIVLCATNRYVMYWNFIRIISKTFFFRPWALDDGFLSRFGQKIHIPLPDNERKEHFLPGTFPLRYI